MTDIIRINPGVTVRRDADSPDRAVIHPYRKGYAAPASLRQLIAAAHKTRLHITVLAAFADCVITLLATTLGALQCRHGEWYVSLIAVPVLAIVIARELRGLECLVHEGSHFNWSRHRRRVNDLLALLLAGAPTGARISEYRTNHLVHHGRFGTSADPDRQRYIELNLETMDRSSMHSFVWDVIRRLPRYQLGWVRILGRNPTYLSFPILWAAVFVGFPLSMAGGNDLGAVGVGLWLASYLLVLPVIRLVGESSEHRYLGTESVFDATISNLGRWQVLLFHPHNDGYHTVHHIWPGIPHHNIKRVHQALLKEDQKVFAACLRQRRRLLDDPYTKAIHSM